jgi:hypothetical protein
MEAITEVRRLRTQERSVTGKSTAPRVISGGNEGVA